MGKSFGSIRIKNESPCTFVTQNVFFFISQPYPDPCFRRVILPSFSSVVLNERRVASVYRFLLSRH